MKRKLTLSEYVKRRNGVALGAQGSLSNMLYRSFGAGSFAQFWQFWNPIWGYYLARVFFIPLKQKLPPAMAVICTFTVSGAVHDLAVMAVKWRYVCLFTPWFFLMGLTVVLSSRWHIRYASLGWPVCAMINFSFVVVNLAVVILLRSVYIG